MARKSVRELARLAGVEKSTNPAFVAGLRLLVNSTDKSLRFIGKVTIGAAEYDIATDAGKVKVFSDVDGFLKVAAKIAEKGNGSYALTVETGEVLASSVPNDMKAWAEAQIIRLNKAKLSQQAVIESVDDQLGLMIGWENGNAAQQAKKAEVTAQRACVVTDIAAIDTEVARLQVIAAG